MTTEENQRDENFLLFESYLKKSMSEKELEAFEQKVKQDPAFRSEFEAFREALLIIGSNEAGALMQEVVQEKRRKHRMLPLAIKLVLAAAVFAFGIYIFSPDPVSEQQWFDEHFEIYPNLYQARSPRGDSSLMVAMAHYETEQYEKALQLFSKINSPDDTVLLYRGISHLGVGRLQIAKHDLQRIQSVFLEEPKFWYLGLLYYKTGRRDSSRYYIKKLLESAKYSVKAQRLMELTEPEN